MQRLTALTLLAATSAVLASCRQITGIEDRREAHPATLADAGTDVSVEATTEAGADAPPPPVCGLPFPAGACAGCIESKCCAESTACAASPACRAREACVAGCAGDSTCRSQCVVDHPVGMDATAPALERCLAVECATACAVGCGGLSYFAPPESAAACNGCIVANVCSTVEACARDLACQSQLECHFGCRTVDCHQRCERPAGDPDAGSPLFASLLTGVTGNCATDCDIGGYWACAGSVTWPLTSVSSIAVTFTVVDFANQAVPLQGVTAKACARLDVGCVTPQAERTTDALGRVTLDIATTPSGPGFSGYFDISGPGITPMMFFLPPLTQSTYALTVPTLSPSALASYAGLAGSTVDPNRGHISVGVGDCLNQPAPRVVLGAVGTDSATQQRYLSGNLPSLTATETDAAGGGVFFNVPIAPIDVTLTPAALGKQVGMMSVFTRKGTLSAVFLGPTP